MKKQEKMYVMDGIIRRWDGAYEGGKLFQSLNEMINDLCNGQYEISFYKDEIGCCLEMVHHDGINSFHVRELNGHGMNCVERDKYRLHEPQLCKKLMGKYYSRPANPEKLQDALFQGFQY